MFDFGFGFVVGACVPFLAMLPMVAVSGPPSVRSEQRRNLDVVLLHVITLCCGALLSLLLVAAVAYVDQSQDPRSLELVFGAMATSFALAMTCLVAVRSRIAQYIGDN